MNKILTLNSPEMSAELWCGIPSGLPLFRLPWRQFPDYNMTFSENWIFGPSYDDDEVLKMDRFTGEILARVTLEHDLGDLRPVVGSRYLANFPYVPDVETLEVVFDAHRVNSQLATVWTSVSSHLGEHYCIFENRYKRGEAGWFVVNLDTLEGEHLQTDLSMPCWLLTRPNVLACRCGDEVQLRDFASQQILARKPLEAISRIDCGNGLVEVFTKNREQYYLDPDDLSEVLVIQASDYRPPEYPGRWDKDRFSPLVHDFVRVDPNIPADMLAVYHWRQQRLLWQVLHRKCEMLGIAGDLMFLNINDQRLIAVDKWTGEHIWELPEVFSPSSVRFWGHHIYISGCPAHGVSEVRCYQWQQPYQSPARPTTPTDRWIIPELAPEDEALMDSVLVATPSQMPEAPQRHDIPPAKEYPDLDTLTAEESRDLYQCFERAEAVSPDGRWKVFGLIDDEYDLVTQYLVLQDQTTGACRRLAYRDTSSPDKRDDDFWDWSLVSAISWDERGVLVWRDAPVDTLIGPVRSGIDVASASLERIDEAEPAWSQDEVEEFWTIHQVATDTGNDLWLDRLRFAKRDQVTERIFTTEYWPDKDWHHGRVIPPPSDYRRPRKNIVVVKCPDGDSTAPVFVTTYADEAFTQEIMAKLQSGEITLPIGLEGDDLGGKLRVACR